MDIPIVIFVNFLRYVLHLLTKGWVTDQLTYTFYRIPLPQVKHLMAQLAILIPLVTSDFERLTNPFGTSWEHVYTTVECALVLE
jgi:hypothetical protein